MAKNVLFLGWQRPTNSREGTAVELFNAFLNYLGDVQKKGQIDNFEPILLSPHGGDLNGFIIVRGDVEKLNALRNEEDFLNLQTQCLINVDGFGVINGWTAEGVQEQMGRYARYIGK